MDLQQPPQILPSDAPRLAAITQAEVAKWRERWTKFLFGGTLPAKQPPLRIREELSERSDSIERFHLTYEVEPGTTTEAYLLRPRDPNGKHLGIVLFHQTDPATIEVTGSLDPEPEESPKEISAVHLVQRGYVVLCPKCFIFGEHRVDEQDAYAGYRAEVKKMQQRHPYWKGLGRMVWDGIRAVDVLATRDDVDHERIGAIGHSLGGKEVLFVAAFDERVKAGVSSDGGIGLTFSNWHDVWYLGQEIREQGFELENHQVLTMIAPRAFLLVGGKYDNDRAWPFIAGVMPLWASLGAPENIGWFRHDADHCWPLEAQKVGYTFLDQRLKEP